MCQWTGLTLVRIISWHQAIIQIDGDSLAIGIIGANAGEIESEYTKFLSQILIQN